MNNKRVFFLNEAAALTKCSPQWLGEIIRKGLLEGQRIGNGRWRVRYADLEKFASQQGIDLDWEALARMDAERQRKRIERALADGVGPNSHGAGELLTMNSS